MREQQIKSKARVSDFGEVYTARKQVTDMLDLVKDQSFDPNATFLEPACGNGNFLAEILRRKLTSVMLHKNISACFELDILRCVSTIYGVDIQVDNVIECRERMLRIVREYAGNNMSVGFWKAVGVLLEKNIICGDTLTATAQNGKGLAFSEWQFKNDGSIVRREHLYTDMLNGNDSIGRYVCTYHYLKHYSVEVA